jgi:hypothetical protein
MRDAGDHFLQGGTPLGLPGIKELNARALLRVSGLSIGPQQS